MGRTALQGSHRLIEFALSGRDLERVKGIEPSTRSLGSYCSTTELHPRRSEMPSISPERARRSSAFYRAVGAGRLALGARLA